MHANPTLAVPLLFSNPLLRALVETTARGNIKDPHLYATSLPILRIAS